MRSTIDGEVQMDRPLTATQHELCESQIRYMMSMPYLDLATLRVVAVVGMFIGLLAVACSDYKVGCHGVMLVQVACTRASARLYNAMSDSSK